MLHHSQTGDFLMPGYLYATTQDSAQILHRLMVRPSLSVKCQREGKRILYLETEIVTIQTEIGRVG
jgi:hypothetical protein